MNIGMILQDAFPDAYNRSMKRGRPYIGQPHTDGGTRGMQLVEGLTMRDICDCFVIGACLASGPGSFYDEASKGEDAILCEDDLYHLPWDNMDIVAVRQNMVCEIERRMGIFPNVPKLSFGFPKRAET